MFEQMFHLFQNTCAKLFYVPGCRLRGAGGQTQLLFCRDPPPAGRQVRQPAPPGRTQKPFTFTCRDEALPRPHHHQNLNIISLTYPRLSPLSVYGEGRGRGSKIHHFRQPGCAAPHIRRWLLSSLAPALIRHFVPHALVRQHRSL